MHPYSLLALALAASLPAQDDAPAAPFAWDVDPDRSVALRRGDEEVWRFHYGADRNKPCFHPLALPGARTITVDSPADHPWHHGLWFSWKLIDGVNYWENASGTGRPAGRTTWRVLAIERRADFSARIELALRYGPNEDATVLDERRVIEVGTPGADGAFTIDWHAAFTAAADCRLDRTPPPDEPGGKAYGGYAGLSLRMVQLDERAAATTLGPVEWNESDRFRADAPAMSYGGVLDGEEVGVAILDHPDNLNAPSPWYAIRTGAMTFFTPAVICRGALALEKDERFALRYRICVHRGRWDPARLRSEHASWVENATSKNH